MKGGWELFLGMGADFGSEAGELMGIGKIVRDKYRSFKTSTDLDYVCGLSVSNRLFGSENLPETLLGELHAQH